jgi:hypothetical protein
LTTITKTMMRWWPCVADGGDDVVAADRGRIPEQLLETSEKRARRAMTMEVTISLPRTAMCRLGSMRSIC